MGKYYIYKHVRDDKGEPFYIGIGSKYHQDDVYGSYTRARVRYGRNKLWKRIVDKTTYKIEIILESDNLDQILDKEKELISFYGRLTDNTGPLANFRLGGERNFGGYERLNVDWKRPRKRGINKGQKYPDYLWKAKSIKVLDTATGKIYNSINEASRETKKYCVQYLSDMLKGNRKNTSTFIKYLNK